MGGVSIASRHSTNIIPNLMTDYVRDNPAHVHGTALHASSLVLGLIRARQA